MPRLDLAATPAFVRPGDPSELSWDADGAPVSIVLDQGIGSVSIPRGKIVVRPTATTEYSGVATYLDGSTARSSVRISVPLPYITAAAAPPAKSRCASSTLSWSVANNPDTVTIDQGIGAVGASGSVVVSPIVTTTYTITAVNQWGTQTATVTVTINDASHTGGANGDTKRPDIYSETILWFRSQANQPAGLYFVEYVSGAFTSQGTGAPYWIIDYVVTDGAGHEAAAPGDGVFYVDQAHAEAGNAGAAVPFCHVGGKPIGIWFRASKYTTLLHGSPDPSFRLVGPAPVVSIAANPMTIYEGSSSTLSWSSNAESQSIDQGVGSVTGSGSTSVTPAASTTFTLTGVTDGFAHATAQALLTVLTLPAPANLEALGGCGQVALSWDAPPAYTGFNVLRSTVHGGPYTLIGAPATPTFVDNPPLPWVTYFYVVQTVNGAVTSAGSGEASADAAAIPAQPIIGRAAPSFGKVVLTWDAVAHADTYTLSRSTASGDELPIATGLTQTRYEDSVAPGRTYFYTLTAINDCGSSLESVEVAATPIAAPTQSIEADPTDRASFVPSPPASSDFVGDPGNSSLFLPDPSTTWS